MIETIYPSMFESDLRCDKYNFVYIIRVTVGILLKRLEP